MQKRKSFTGSKYCYYGIFSVNLAAFFICCRMSAHSGISSVNGKKLNYHVSASARNFSSKKKGSGRIVPPFSIESLQKNTRVQEPQINNKGKELIKNYLKKKLNDEC